MNKAKKPKRILLTGAGGMLGMRLAPRLRSSFKSASVYSVFHAPVGSANEVFDCSAVGDLTDDSFLRSVIERSNPDLIINLAALTNVELCERNPELAQTVNTKLTSNLLNSAPSSNFVQLSTDYVFDGAKGNYTPQDKTAPLSVYGKTKLLAEEAVGGAAEQNRNLIIRTSGTYDWLNEKNLFSYFLSSLSKNKQIHALSDCHYSPIWADDLAQGIVGLIKAQASGIHHYAGPERVDRSQFARTIADVFEFNTNLITAQSISKFNWRAQRPTDSSLVSEPSYNLAKVAPKPLALAFATMQIQLSSKAQALVDS